jgi:hypothetical protein
MTETEVGLEAELRQHVVALQEIGERNVDHPLRLAEATDWVVGVLEGYGLQANRQGYSFGDEVVQNLVVHVPGLRRGDHVVVVGARFDSPVGSVGADDNASGVAALLCLARRLAGKRPSRSVELVWFADAASRRDTAASGAAAFTARVKSDQTKITAMIELHGLGAFNDAPNSQRELVGALGMGETADFIGVATYPEHAVLSEYFTTAFERAASLPVRRLVSFSDAPPVAGAAHGDFLAAGFPSLLVFDTHTARHPGFGGPSDTLEALDFARMARVVAGLEQAILALAGPIGEAPLAHAPSSPSEAIEGAAPAKQQSQAAGAEPSY